MTPFAIEWVFPDAWPALPAPEKAWTDAELERIRDMHFRGAARRWRAVLPGWPVLEDGEPLVRPDGQPFTALKIRVAFADFTGAAAHAAARVPQGRMHCLQPSAGQPYTFPYDVVMEIDLKDLAAVRSHPARFHDTIVHEIGHALGIGTRWLDATPPLVREVKPGRHDYVGRAGCEAYRQLTGAARSGIPLDVDVHQPRAFHWSERLLRLEIMSTELDDSTVDQIAKGGRVAISPISVGALEDLGYCVNRPAAEMLRLDQRR